MVAPVLIQPILTTAGRFGTSYLLKKFFEFGKDKFTSQYGTSALDSILMLDDNTVNQEFQLYKNETEKDKDISRTVTDTPAGLVIGGGAKEPLPPPEPFTTPVDSSGPITLETPKAEEMDTTVSTPEVKPVDTTLSTPIPKESGPIIFTKDDTSKQTEELFKTAQESGYYSRVVKSITDTKQNKMPKEQWANKIKGSKLGINKDEYNYLGLDRFLKGKDSITKEQLLEFVEQKDVAGQLKIIEIPKQDQYDFRDYMLGGSDEPLQFVLQLDPSKGGQIMFSARSDHFDPEYSNNTLAHFRAQIGYFNPEKFENRLIKNYGSVDRAPSTEQETLELSKFLEGMFNVTEGQSDVIQKGQKNGFISDFDVIKNTELEKYFKEKNIDYTLEYEPNIKGNIIRFKDKNSTRGLPTTVEGRYDVFTKNGNLIQSFTPDSYGYNNNLTDELQLQKVKNYIVDIPNQYKMNELKGIAHDVPIKDSAAFARLILNSAIREAVIRGLPGMSVTSGEFQVGLYFDSSQVDSRSLKSKEGLRNFYNKTFIPEFEKIAKQYGIKLEKKLIPNPKMKSVDDIGEPDDDIRFIKNSADNSLQQGYTLRKVNGDVLTRTLEILSETNEGVSDLLSLYSEKGTAQGYNILNVLDQESGPVDIAQLDTPANKNDYYIWVKKGGMLDSDLKNKRPIESLLDSFGEDVQKFYEDIDRNMPISFVKFPTGDSDTFSNNFEAYTSYLGNYPKASAKGLEYPEEDYFILRMIFPKKLEEDIIDEPIKLTQLEKQTNRLLA